MELAVSEDIIKKTTRCKKGFSCLSGERKDICRVELCIDDKIHFLKCSYDNFCGYQVPFGYSSVCTCPVRKELFNRYKI
ncbi:MAG TPA: hypothetical protein VIO58_05230 [Candidatus Methanoperedens sp.]